MTDLEHASMAAAKAALAFDMARSAFRYPLAAAISYRISWLRRS